MAGLICPCLNHILEAVNQTALLKNLLKNPIKTIKDRGLNNLLISTRPPFDYAQGSVTATYDG